MVTTFGWKRNTNVECIQQDSNDRAMWYRSRTIRKRCRSANGPNFTFDFSWSVTLTLSLCENRKVFPNYCHQMTRHFHFRSQPAATAYAHCSLLVHYSVNSIFGRRNCVHYLNCGSAQRNYLLLACESSFVGQFMGLSHTCRRAQSIPSN